MTDDKRRILSGAVWKTDAPKEYKVIDHAENKVYKVIEQGSDYKIVDLQQPIEHRAKLKRNQNEIKKFAQIMDGN